MTYYDEIKIMVSSMRMLIVAKVIIVKMSDNDYVIHLN